MRNHEKFDDSFLSGCSYTHCKLISILSKISLILLVKPTHMQYTPVQCNILSYSNALFHNVNCVYIVKSFSVDDKEDKGAGEMNHYIT